MSDVDGKTPMTEREIGLVKAIVRWRRGQGGTFFLNRKNYGFAGAYGFGEWRSRERTGPAVAFEREAPTVVIETPNYREECVRHHEVESVTQAVDLLCALGRLPQRFSSAYWNGTMDAVAQVAEAVGAKAEMIQLGDLFAMGYNTCHDQVLLAISDLRNEAL